MSEQYGSHYSVLKEECIHYLSESYKHEPFFIADLTFGAGGHTFALAEKFEKVIVHAVDQDPDAIINGNKNILLKNLKDKVNLHQMNFSSFADFCAKTMPEMKFQGILLDLGVSSHQFDTFSRGFSFREDGPLDMRMDYQNNSLTAADIINQYDEKEIADILFVYGEERYSRKIAREIVNKRKTEPFLTTKQLENLIFHCYPASERHRGPHPATRSFQALRIAVNAELDVLKDSLNGLYQLLAVGGRLCIISFHSLEDRIVKHTFKEIVENNPNYATILTKKPIVPSPRELEENSRSRSAKLRVLEKNLTKDGYDQDKKKWKKQNKFQA